MSKQNLERKEVNGLTFFKRPFSRDWVISGVDICRYMGYKNPYEQAKQIYKRNEKQLSDCSTVLVLPTPCKKKNGRGQCETENMQEIRSYNRVGCMFFISRCDVEKAKDFTKRMFVAFDALVKILETKNTLEWKTEREQGKVARREFTDAVSTFIDYAKSQGSQSADLYYVNFSKMESSVLFGIKKDIPKNFRDNLSPYELAVLRIVELSSCEELYSLMEKGIYYKDVFQKLKESALKKSMAIVSTVHD